MTCTSICFHKFCKKKTRKKIDRYLIGKLYQFNLRKIILLSYNPTNGTSLPATIVSGKDLARKGDVYEYRGDCYPRASCLHSRIGRRGDFGSPNNYAIVTFRWLSL